MKAGCCWIFCAADICSARNEEEKMAERRDAYYERKDMLLKVVVGARMEGTGDTP